MASLASRLAALAVLAPLATVLIACGSGTGDPPDAARTTAPGPVTPGGPTTVAPPDRDDEDGPRFGFGLPVGDEDVQDTEVAMYNLVRTRQCHAAQRTLDAGAWRRLTSQRDVLLFQAGIHLCRGDVAAARPWYLRTKAHLGGIGSTRNLCQLYQAVASVVEQRPRDHFPCDRGAAPEWPNGRDDPRTDVDEGAAPSEDPAAPSEEAVPSEPAAAPSGGAGPDGV